MAALERFANECARQDHMLCGGDEQCVEALSQAEVDLERERRAEGFDAGKERLTLDITGSMHQWSTTALVRTVRDLVLTPPYRDWLRRSIGITSALARLGERGISPDAVIRTGLGPELVRRIVSEASAFWIAFEAGSISKSTIPEVVQGWCELLAAEPRLNASRQDIGGVVSSALVTKPGEVATEWLKTAAVAHILGWRIIDYLHVERLPEDLVLSGGRDATRWFMDRFTKTYLHEWCINSYLWELAFMMAPAGTASTAGIARDLLDERVVTQGMVLPAIAKHLATPSGDDEVERGIQIQDAIAALGALLGSEQFATARTMAGRLYEAHPRDQDFAVAYAFCSIPADRSEAERLLAQLGIQDGSRRSLVLANQATCALLDGDLPRASDLARPLADGDAVDAVAWLWDPREALQGRTVVRMMTVAEWLSDLQGGPLNRRRP